MTLFEKLMDKISGSLSNKINLGKEIHSLKALLKNGYWKRLEKLPPRKAFFNVIDVCNANCVFCPAQKLPSEGIMELPLYRKSIKELDEIGTKSINFSALYGEPLLDPHLFQRIEMASSHGFKTILTTNGIRLSENENVEKLIEKGIDKVNVSMPGFGEKSYAEIFRVDKKNYGKAISGIAKLLRYRGKVDCHLSIRYNSKIPELFQSPGFKHNILPLVNKNFIKENIHLSKKVDNWGGLISEEDLPEGMFLLKPPSLKPVPCKWTFSVAILPGGTVRLCPCRVAEQGKQDELTVGNIRETRLREIWYGKKTKELRRMFSTFDGRELPEACRDCSFYSPP
ncbi:hypothetical protein AKJ45_00205 [candidate division MSBL1 archaeon SCGC-AAA261F19]|uniref:Radical SAM core domain-containing protein n=1 Tax=candidate division MSBL1 archaeon SCGC-AAA261F19 TaxID=1698275 RepID=A0A133VBM8_9EURY|nr:hypothetical protein AKJ45_00205 [candidate division MSBL1 archaeon SCGC-AAA261F19]